VDISEVCGENRNAISEKLLMARRVNDMLMGGPLEGPCGEGKKVSGGERRLPLGQGDSKKGS